MKPIKKPVSYRLSEATIRELADIAKRNKVSQSDIITILIHWLYTDGEDTWKIQEALDTAALL